MKFKKYTFLYLCPENWSAGFHRRPLINAISWHSDVERVYVIEVPADLVHAPLSNWPRIRNAFRSFFKGPDEKDGIKLYTPFIFLHHLIGYRLPVIRSLNILLFNLSMRRLLKNESVTGNILFSVYRPEMLDFTHFQNDLFLIYDCYDDYLLTPQDKKIAALESRESELMARSHIVFTTSQKLLEKSLQYNKNSFLIPNAADTELFGRAYSARFDKPDDITEIASPIIGYIGALRDWQDFELLTYVIEQNPDKSFLFIGRCRKSARSDMEKLKKHANVYFLGQKNYADLPAYLHYIEVAIIPNKINQFNQSVVPIKLFEYLAAGKKIVSSNTSVDLKMHYKDYIIIAGDKYEFSAKLNTLLQTEKYRSKEIFSFGQQQSWNKRTDEMFSYITKTLN